jgi:hypothetical protein
MAPRRCYWIPAGGQRASWGADEAWGQTGANLVDRSKPGSKPMTSRRWVD